MYHMAGCNAAFSGGPMELRLTAHYGAVANCQVNQTAIWCAGCVRNAAEVWGEATGRARLLSPALATSSWAPATSATSAVLPLSRSASVPPSAARDSSSSARRNEFT